METTRYSRQQLIEFFKILDSLLSKKANITVIGGTAMILGYKIDRGTTDIDPWGSIVADVQKNWDEAIRQSGVIVKIDTGAGVAQAPEGLEDRLIPIKDIPLKNLRIFYPETHDLVLMKITRNVDIDIADIDALHKAYKLKEKILLDRFLNELIYIGNQKDLDLKYLATIERLFGDKIAEKHETEITKRRSHV